MLIGGAALIATTMARAQPTDPIGDLLQSARPMTVTPAAQRWTVATPLSDPERARLVLAIEAARRGEVSRARNTIGEMSDRVARKLATWVLVDANSQALTFSELDGARRDLAGFPRPGRRQTAAERVLETSGRSPNEIVAWFGDEGPQGPLGALALASAKRSLGQREEAEALIRKWWRETSFEADAQRTILARFGDALTADDHARRADMLLYGAQGPAARDMIPLLPADRQAAALARIALRGGSEGAYNTLPPEDQGSEGVSFERAALLRRRGDEAGAIEEFARHTRHTGTPEHAERAWDERYRLTLAAIRIGDWRDAYRAAANTGLTTGADAAEAEFYAGWIALSRLKDPKTAAGHFANIARMGVSPITRGRAAYWQGRAAEADCKTQDAAAFYRQGAEHLTTFYGQLSAEKLGLPLTLPPDPVPTGADRASFEGSDAVQAMRLAADLGQKDLFRIFALHLDDTLPTRAQGALLVDAIRGYGDQDTSMKAARALAQRGMILADRGYPYRTPPDVPGAPEPALVLGITRQESGFDPGVRSHADARGMMQLLPSTAAIVARRMGVPYSAAQLYEPDYNMRLGSSFLGQLIRQFSGSYIMATAGYNAGPGRPVQWSAFCGDPRGSANDPLDFIECIPFSETRNYVMRVLENTQVYRAKLSGGSIPITLSHDLKRGAYAGPSAAVALAP
jgi:soluble lytic murein transglycosylase